jgi:flagella basal body P-ring formation protein FlgA
MDSSRLDLKFANAAVLAMAMLLGAGGPLRAADALPDNHATVTKAADLAAIASDLEAQIQAQLPAMVPLGMRVDRVTLGCKPAAHAILRTIAPGFARLNSRSFMVELQDDQRSVYCPATMDASRQVLVATRDIQPSETITADDFQLQWIDAFSGAVSALPAFPDQGPYASAAVIRAGQPLYQSSITRPIAVRAGEMVTVMVKNGPVQLRTQLQAQSQGAVGDSVTLINPGSGTPVMVTVTGPHVAELVMQ